MTLLWRYPHANARYPGIGIQILIHPIMHLQTYTSLQHRILHHPFDILHPYSLSLFDGLSVLCVNAVTSSSSVKGLPFVTVVWFSSSSIPPFTPFVPRIIVTCGSSPFMSTSSSGRGRRCSAVRCRERPTNP